MNIDFGLGFSPKKLPIILQDEVAECGHACVAMISNFLGHDLDLYTLRKLSPPSNRGVTLLDLNQLLENLNFRTRALRVPLDELNMVKCPAIIHWNMNHFVVLKKVTKNYIVIHDPAVGAKKCAMEEVSQLFTGIVLEVERATDFSAINTRKSLRLSDFMKSIHGITGFVILLLLLSLAIEIFTLLNPLFMQFVTDNVIGNSDGNNLYAIALAFALVVLIQVFSEYIRGNLITYVTNHLTEQFSANVVKHLLKLPLSFFEKRHKGDIQSKFQSIDQIQKKISSDFINTVLDGLMIIVTIAVMLIYSAYLTTIVLFALLLYLAIRSSSFHFLQKQTEASINHHARAASVFLETLHGILPIKVFLKENVQFNNWRNCYIKCLNADVKVSRVNVIYQGANQLMFHLEHIIVVCIGATLVLANTFSLGMLMAFLSYRLLLVNKAANFIHNIFDYKLIGIQLNRLSDILFHSAEEIANAGKKITHINGSLRLKNLKFHYDYNTNPVLDDINLEIKAGEKIAIIGSSGCGKSTLLKVMMGLLEKTAGEIYIDDVAIADFGLQNYRQLTAAVMQEDTLLSGSIVDNIAFFAEEIDLDRVHEVAKLACIHEDIMRLPMAYETLVGDMGSTISGGQKQRILLARALYKQPKFLFLDEATSHLDSNNERAINHALKALNITQIIIAHRQETIAMADRVVDLEIINRNAMSNMI